MELEYFTNPKDTDKFYKYWINNSYQWLHQELDFDKANLK